MAGRTLLSVQTLTRNLLSINRACRFNMQREFASSQILPGQIVNYEKKGSIALVTVNDPSQKVNTLTQTAMEEFQDIMKRITDDEVVRGAVVISGKSDCFIAGADIGMLQKSTTKEELTQLSASGQEVLKQIEDCPKPIVAAIMGTCMGGGLEVALACHHRVAMNDKKTILALPEVMLGLLPGAGGTVRLPQLVPVPEALPIMLTGKNIKPVKAKRMGLVDAVVDPVGPGLKEAKERSRDYLEEIALQKAHELSLKGVTSPNKRAAERWAKKSKMQKLQATVMGLIIKYKPDFIFGKAKGQVMKLTKGNYPAPLRIIEVVKTGVTKGPKAGYEAEAKAFGDLGFTNESKALMGLYHGRTHCKKNHFGQPQKKVENLAVLGAGLMGAGIVEVSIDKGIRTTMKDMATQGLTRGYEQIEKNLKTSVKKKKRSQFEADMIMNNAIGTLTYDNFDKQDMVIEAVFEDIGIKHRVVKEVEEQISPHCVFASNTSALPIADIAKASKRPEKMIGMHYFSPVDKMELLEIITTDQTSKDTIASAVDVGLRQGKSIIVVKDGPGFYTTRALAAYMSEVFKVLQEGMAPDELDKFTKGIGFPVGSATLVDEVGVDVAYHVGEFTGKTFGARFGFSENDTTLLQQMMDNGYMGRKSGLGIFDYTTKSKKRPVNQGAQALLDKFQTKPLMEMSDENVRLRLLCRFANEAILIMQEGILANPLEGDFGAVFGLGFPPNLGGPFRFVDGMGADKVVEAMQRFEAVYGERFTPCQLLLDHAKNSKKFHTK